MRTRYPFLVLIFAILSIVPVIAQATVCPALVEQALTAVGDNCDGMSRNSACYGYDSVETSFIGDFPSDYFTTPADRAGLTEIDTLKTAAMDLANNRWGVAVMNVQANLPNTIPGQGVIMMLMGDSEIHNAVTPDEATVLVDPLSLLATREVGLYSSPSATSTLVKTVLPNDIVLVDGYNPDLEWLRVSDETSISWIPSDAVLATPEMQTLPIVGASNPTPMQAFYFSTGIGAPECNEAESMIAVQSPENIKIDLTVNGVDIRVGSLVTFQNMDAHTISMTVHRGSVQTVFGNVVNAGETAIGVLNDANGIAAWSDNRPVDENEKDRGERAQDGINILARANGWLERSIDDNPQPPATEEPTNNDDQCINKQPNIHVVQAGESLFGIARLCNASMPDIISANNLQAPFTLFSAQELIIPNPGSGFVSLPDVPVDVPPNPCLTLKLTSPLGGAPSELATYYWDGVAEATQYQVNIFDGATGQSMASFLTNGNETNISLSIGVLGVGGEMQWQVVALQNGQPICNVMSPPMPHLAPITAPVEPEVKPGFYIDMYCDSLTSGVLIVGWDNAKGDDTVAIVIYDQFSGTSRTTSKGKTGSVSFSVSGYPIVRAEATTTSGRTAVDTGNLNC